MDVLHAYVLSASDMIGIAWQVARSEPLKALLVTIMVTTFAWAWIELGPRRRRRSPIDTNYLRWLEWRADQLERCATWYATNGGDDGTEARRVLALVNGE